LLIKLDFAHVEHSMIVKSLIRRETAASFGRATLPTPSSSGEGGGGLRRGKGVAVRVGKGVDGRTVAV